jgi:hypothetical protein
MEFRKSRRTTVVIAAMGGSDRERPKSPDPLNFRLQPTTPRAAAEPKR